MESISVRLATDADSEEIFNWRNDEKTRMMSHTTDMVEWEGHSKWLESTLENPNRCLLMCCIGESNDNVAIVRFDVDADTALISINLAPSMRNKGLAKPCLQEAMDFFKKIYNDVDCIKAEIKSINTASRRAFEGVGFCLTKEVDEVRYYTAS